MVHYTQEIRKENLELIKKMIAKQMPLGIPDKTFRVLIMREHGFSQRAVADYLSVLLIMEEIELGKDLRWKLVFEKVKAKNKDEV